jgi:hypothetical protein
MLIVQADTNPQFANYQKLAEPIDKSKKILFAPNKTAAEDVKTDLVK